MHWGCRVESQCCGALAPTAASVHTPDLLTAVPAAASRFGCTAHIWQQQCICNARTGQQHTTAVLSTPTAASVHTPYPKPAAVCQGLGVWPHRVASRPCSLPCVATGPVGCASAGGQGCQGSIEPSRGSSSRPGGLEQAAAAAWHLQDGHHHLRAAASWKTVSRWTVSAAVAAVLSVYGGMRGHCSAFCTTD
jgi:hypothetical protein